MIAEYVICLVGRIANHAAYLFYEFKWVVEGYNVEVPLICILHEI